VGSQEAARDIDHAFKRFLKRVWGSRKRVVKDVEGGKREKKGGVVKEIEEVTKMEMGTKRLCLA